MMDWPTRAWILCTPRSGSTLLADLLNLSVGREAVAFIKNPQRECFGEHFHTDHCATWEQFQKLDPIVTKMHMHWLEERGGDIPADTSIIRLHRRDRVAQTWSLISTGRIGFCHVVNEQQRQGFLTSESHVTTTRREFMDHYHAIERWERLMTLITSRLNVLDVWYEDLVADRAGTLANVMGFLGFTPDQWIVPESTGTLAIHEGS